MDIKKWFSFFKRAKLQETPKEVPNQKSELPPIPAPTSWIPDIDEDSDDPINVELIWKECRDGKELNKNNRRKPVETWTSYETDASFVAAGKEYTSVDQLRVSGRERISRNDEYGFHDKNGMFLDIYGRKVFYISKRFPCFDSYDRRYDSRFYRTYYLCEEGKLTCISLADKSSHFTVTEDVNEIEYAHWDELNSQRWIIWN